MTNDPQDRERLAKILSATREPVRVDHRTWAGALEWADRLLAAGVTLPPAPKSVDRCREHFQLRGTNYLCLIERGHSGAHQCADTEPATNPPAPTDPLVELLRESEKRDNAAALAEKLRAAFPSGLPPKPPAPKPPAKVLCGAVGPLDMSCDDAEGHVGEHEYNSPDGWCLLWPNPSPYTRPPKPPLLTEEQVEGLWNGTTDWTFFGRWDCWLPQQRVMLLAFARAAAEEAIRGRIRERTEPAEGNAVPMVWLGETPGLRCGVLPSKLRALFGLDP